MNQTQPKIRIENLIKIYGDKPQFALKLMQEGADRTVIQQQTGQVIGLDRISFDLQPGELFVVMGLSGSGKSTLVRCINRLIEPTSGQIWIDDQEITRADAKQLREIRLKKISMVFQQFGLFPHKTVAENVGYGLQLQGLSAAQRHHVVMKALETVGLQDWSAYHPTALSGGMQQRVGLARALATDPDILLMDEPFSALDPLIRRQVQDQLLYLQQALKKTIVFISHDIHEALKLGDRIAVMKDGYIVQIGTPEELISNPTNDYIRAFMQDVNFAQMLKSGSIARKTVPFILGRDSANSALQQMQQQRLKYMYVLNREGKLVGLLKKDTLQSSIDQGQTDILALMQTNFPQVHPSTRLESLFPLYQSGLPVAVVDADGQLKGMIEPSDILTTIGRLSQSAESPSIAIAS